MQVPEHVSKRAPPGRDREWIPSLMAAGGQIFAPGHCYTTCTPVSYYMYWMVQVDMVHNACRVYELASYSRAILLLFSCARGLVRATCD